MRKTLEEIIQDLDAFRTTMERHKTEVSEQIAATTQGQIAIVRTYMQRLLENEKSGKAIAERSTINLRKNVSLFSEKAVTNDEKAILNRLQDELAEFSADLAANRIPTKRV